MINQDDINKIKADLEADERRKTERERTRNRQRLCWAAVATFAAIPVTMTVCSMDIISGGLSGGVCICLIIASVTLLGIGTRFFETLPFNP